MGFLMGAYGKLMAGQRMRSIQFQLTTVQSRLRRITREIGQKEKIYQAQERNMKTQMQNQMQAAIWGASGLFPGMDVSGMTPDMMINMWGGMTPVQKTQYAQFTQMVQMQYAQSQTMWQNMFEMQKEADLQALKDVEEDLQIEKDNLESQLKIAQADYEANKEMEKQGAQNLKPDYTGQA